jgi:TetR/AcrR family transcriptional regulator, regulator of cefoperazone and chloramphenicol sensitivity
MNERAWWSQVLDPQDEHGRRRTSLLHAAFAVIAEAGFEGLRTRAVAQRAGVNIATLHYYFPSKQDLVQGLAELIAAKFVTLHGPAPHPSGIATLDRLRQEFSDVRFYVKSQPEMLLVMQEFQMRGKRDHKVQEIFTELSSHWREGIEKIVDDGLADGAFREEIPPQEMSALLLAVVSGIAYGAEDVDAVERGVEAWILSARAKKNLENFEEQRNETASLSRGNYRRRPGRPVPGKRTAQGGDKRSRL